MDDTIAPAPKPGPPPTHLLRCHPCGRTIAATEGDVLRFIHTGWPKCCGEVMSVFVEAPTAGQKPK